MHRAANEVQATVTACNTGANVDAAGMTSLVKWVASADVMASTPRTLRACSRKRAVLFLALFLFSLGGQAPHVLRAHMGRACGEPNEIELTPHWGEIERIATRTLFALHLLSRAAVQSCSGCRVQDEMVQSCSGCRVG